VVSIFGDNRKTGRWLVPERFRVFSVFGSAKIDLREAVLQHQVTVIEALAICADVQIIVPPDVIVECDGDALLGAFTVSESKRAKRANPRPPGSPIVRVEGSAYLASVTVKVRPPK
jgi:predicted membrane protein